MIKYVFHIFNNFDTGEQNDFDARRAVFKYHRLCADQSDLYCFYDDAYFCVCPLNESQAACISYDHSLDKCSHCLSNGFCLRSDLRKPDDSVCLCPQCFYGRFCQYNAQAFSLTLDSLIAKDKVIIQIIYICIVSIMVLIGTFNNICTFVTLKRSSARQFSIGNHLFVIMLLDQCSLFFLLAKIIHIVLGISGYFINWYTVNLLSCKIVSYLLSVSVAATFWLTTWISIERACMVLFPTMMYWKKPNLAIKVDMVLLIIIFTMDIHEILYYIVIQDGDSKTLCVTNFTSSFISTYARFSVVTLRLVPFFIQVISVLSFILLLAHSRIKLTSRQATFRQAFKNQLKANKELFYLPTIIVLSALPQVFLSFTFSCTEIFESWQRYMLLSASFISYARHTFGFLLYILPSSKFKREFAETDIAKKLFKITKTI